ncbi:uncharacterized protein LOC115739925 isoform X2 [Rhodamnia argentea]|uniref:Uncharacterized protein LOC115739925 isoform X2 n=1 Tax=Rhodamnia argentea TaxID=178133 RepID=A0A8B8P5C5_9MYRT|nr:uncharacterized protein LOC115739925 isoform X2 [Rhodamnia argentea]
MASPPCGWSWSPIRHSPMKSPCYCSFRAHLRRFAACSLRDSPRPPPSSSNAAKPGSQMREAKELAASRSSPKPKEKNRRRHASGSDLDADVSQGRQSLISKSLLGKRPPWRRMLFASKKVRSIVLLNVATFIYATNIPVVKEVESVMDPAVFNVVRFAVSAIPFVPMVIQSWDDVQTRNAGIELGIWVSLGYLMQALGLLTSDAGRATFLSMLTIIVVPLLDGMLGAIIPTRTWFGAFMSVIGVAMLESSGSPPCVGDLLNFLSAIFFGIHLLRTERISRATDKRNFLPLIGHQVCVIAISSSLWYFIGGWVGGIQEFDASSWTWPTIRDSVVQFPWIPALYTGIFSTGLCLWVEMAAMCDVSATETAIIYGLEPVWGAGFAWLLLGERWGITGWIGAALVLAGSLTVQICGSSPPYELDDDEEMSKQSSLSSSPVVVSSKKGIPDTFKK